MSAPPLPDAFGNYAISGIVELLPPAAVSWLPVTDGWKVLAVILFALLCRAAYRYYRRWRHNRYRREALVQLDQLGETPREQQLAQLAVLLKSTALAAWPREEVAALSGEAWLRWLGTTTPAPVFSEASASLLGRAQYRVDASPAATELDRLALECGAWIRQHEAPAP